MRGDEPADITHATDARWERRVGRERRARLEAEDLLEAKSRELYEANQTLARLAADLERRVEERTSELDRARSEAMILAERDQLTGLANRMCFGRVLGEALSAAEVERGCVALLLIDVDRFKQINDTLGHGAGDALLKGLAGRILAITGDRGFVARLGGDEFAVVIPANDATTTSAAIGRRILAAAMLPLSYSEQCLESSCSIGIAVYPDDAQTIVDLQRFADIALYRSKALGRARQTFFDSALRAEFEQRAILGAELQGAIETGQIAPFFQPIILGSSGRTAGVEVLARWQHPARGLLTPDLFIGLAEERGLIGYLFVHQLRAACSIVRPWIERGLVEYLSINISPTQFRSGSLVETVFRVLAETGFAPSALTIEITEELLLFDLDRTRHQLERLAEGGIRISLDDFGTGYSNIAYLRRLPIHTLKLDRMITSDVGRDAKARSVLKAIVMMARSLDLKLVAEGVETEVQARWLSRLGCEFLQGYLYGRPMVGPTLFDECLTDPKPFCTWPAEAPTRAERSRPAPCGRGIGPDLRQAPSGTPADRSSWA